MRIVAEFDLSQAPRLLWTFTGFVSLHTWRKRISAIQRQSRENRLLVEHLAEAYRLELAMAEAIAVFDRTGSFPSTSDDVDFFHLIAFIKTFIEVHNASSNRAQEQLLGMLRSGVENEGLASLAHELSVATHLSRKGFDVIFSDIEIGGGCDFIASREALQFEVECKHISRNIGRKIHSDDLAKLGALALPILGSYARANKIDVIAHLTLKSRLRPNSDHLSQVVKEIECCLETNCPANSKDVAELEIYKFDSLRTTIGMQPKERFDEAKVQKLIELHLGRELSHVVGVFDDERTALLALDSKQADTVLSSIDSLIASSAKRQLGPTRPGILVAHLPSLSETELASLKEAEASAWKNGTGLQRMITRLFERRPHLYTVAFTVPQTITETSWTSGSIRTRQLSMSGGVYHFLNSDHPKAAIDTQGIF